ncbi:MAG: UDP-4-amino-4,6-dideoxy-N-acetyl-beta-L-altrosamine transaminase [Alphaproteobacteria bacterium]|nr:UDP-4-amino-4,6-dideoxy-N-acetyl-beta-L-altrosamine transaminase [Alphaproteobacteria bacterium]|tara:strand:+ start:1682 stop:2899 length:1218 start_codon:yes stop_codon:yes gene_type:complete
MTKKGKRRFLPYGRQTIEDDDIEAVVSVLKSDFLTTGPKVKELESEFSKFLDVPHAVSCSSGSAALHLAYLSMGLKQGDYVVVPAVTFLSTANMARHVGAEIIFSDVDPETGLANADNISSAIERSGKKISAITAVHMSGQISEMDAISKVASESGAQIIEDACHALGSIDSMGDYVGRCSKSSATIFSLHPVKAIAGGEGGIVTTRDPKIAQNMRLMQNHGIIRENFLYPDLAFSSNKEINPWYYEMLTPGFNYRLSDIHAALAKQQLSKLELFVKRRNILASKYDSAISAMPNWLKPFVKPVRRTLCETVAWHLYVILVDFEGLGCDRASVVHHMKNQGIGTQVHYLPLHMQPYYRERYGIQCLPGSENWYSKALSLPLHPRMEDSDVDRVIEVLCESLDKCL